LTADFILFSEKVVTNSVRNYVIFNRSTKLFKPLKNVPNEIGLAQVAHLHAKQIGNKISMLLSETCHFFIVELKDHWTIDPDEAITHLGLDDYSYCFLEKRVIKC
jgi:hypothetical protein